MKELKKITLWQCRVIYRLRLPEDIKDIYNNSEYQDAIAYTLGNSDVYNKAKEEALKTLNDQNENDFWSWLTGKGWGRETMKNWLRNSAEIQILC